MKTAFVTSLGCKVNQYEVELFIEKLEDNGFVVFPYPEGVDVCIVNTCAVTAIASRKSRQMIRKLRKMNPNALVIAVGCHSKEDYQKLEQSGADIVLNNQQKSDFMRYIVEDN
ncbi:MAG: tRNA (N(6)-L-threonylcarbamoyladenosine(37)-C(2))-methylthiotransferase MtaB, partial [Thermotogaceae bacterium]|nr:tRNA (N(6)-L-threonylcarbamoyladenosine(37)-C(2))-methylthiotransferase MtaB [Thermotogaceae bacterium]